MPDPQVVPIAVDQPGNEPVSEDERQIEGYHKALHGLFKGATDIITAQACASFMGCIMAHSDDWRRIIPGYTQETLAYAKLAFAAHKEAESIQQPTNGAEDGDCKSKA